MLSLFRSTPIRLAALLGASLLIGLAIAGAVIYGTVGSELRERVERTVREHFDEIVRSAEGDLSALTLEVYGYALAADDYNRVYLLLDQDGRVLAGNIVSAAIENGWSTTGPEAFGLPLSGQTYRVLAGPVETEWLVVGISYAEAEQLAGVVLEQLAWSGAGFLVLVIVVGSLVARRGQRRLQSIADTMGRIGRGELAARIPMSRGNSDLDVLAGEVNAALERLSALVEAMRQVSADIAHELKTPLSRLSISVENALQAEATGTPVAPYLDQAQEEGRRLNAVFEALLRIAQIESGARRSRFVPVDLGPVLASLCDAYGAVAEESGMRLLLAAPDSLPVIHGDRELLAQMIANLIENAIRHCPPGTLIELRTHADSQTLHLEVADTGPGIPAEERERVFRRLYRLEKSRTTPGNGLGMSLIKAVVDLHGASIELGDNRPGLIVTLRFPLLRG